MLKRIWYEKRTHSLSLLLIPVGWLYCLITNFRRWAYSSGLFHSNKLSVPVIIVGNISVGGTGKTPLVIWIIDFLKRQGWKPGVISRGYGGKAGKLPQEVGIDSDPALVGDEPVVIARHTSCPVYVSPDRFAAGKALLANNECDIIVCDDGLQHYSLHRDFEICVIDGKRRHGNGRCLPSGPLREAQSRLRSVDAIVCNGAKADGEFSMVFEPVEIKQVKGSSSKSFEDFMDEKVHAVAGTGNPDRFFEALRDQGLNIVEHPFDDHYKYKRSDFDFGDKNPVIMTEKDAVKCTGYAQDNHWYLSIVAKLPEIFEHRLVNLLKQNLELVRDKPYG